MHVLAKQEDTELGAETVESPTHGSCAERVGEALPDIPAELLHLHDLVLPINKEFDPVEKWGEEPSG
eukprot:4441529-Pyramimonas_sp.AAC.1